MLTLIQLPAINRNKRKTNKIIPAVCGRQTWPPRAESSLCCWERHQATSSCSCQTTKKKWKHDLWKGSTCEGDKGWDWINLRFISCLNMAPDTRRDHPQWISPAEGAEPGHLFCFRSQTLGVLNPSILYTISGCNEEKRVASVMTILRLSILHQS